MSLYAILWLVALVAFVVFEMATMGLYTIWFAGGSLGAFVVAMLGGNGWVQMTMFLIVSAILLLVTRPIAMERINRKHEKTNIDSLIGLEAKVLEKIDNHEGTGRVMLNGQEWMARAASDSDTFEANTFAIVEGIAGVKLIVKKMEE